MDKIKWLYPNKLSLQDIQKVEKYFDIKFPDDYISCVLDNDEAYPIPNVFLLENKEESFNNLLSVKSENLHGIIFSYDGMKQMISTKLIPFADDGCGNKICFDYRESKTTPTVVFWDYEKACIEYNNSGNTGSSLNYDNAITYICDSFTELLDMLHEPEEE